MNKENVITKEQRARISEKFRAAKALLARKRPFHTTSTLDIQKNRDNNETAISRLPLTEVLVNTPSKCGRLTELNSIRPCPERVLRKKVEGGMREYGCNSNLFITPIKQNECGFDDDFDELVLKEIDAICEERSGRKVKDQDPPHIRSDGNENGGNGWMCLDSGTVTMVLESEGTVELRDRIEGSVEGSDRTESTNIGNFPLAYSDYLQALNEHQKEAACSNISIPLMIVAGPGSGKTSTMVGRVLMLLNEGIGPSNILAMTFTTAAASEMRDRIGAVAGKEAAKKLTISTFHSFCLQLCRTHADKLGRTPEFLIYGHGQQRRAILETVRLFESKKSMGENLDASKIDQYGDMKCAQYFKDKSKKWEKFVTQAKASGKTPAECRKIGDEIGAMILENYNGILRSCNALDYHDLISCSVNLLTDFPGVREQSQDLWKAMVIDEFQDTSATQYNFLRILASHNHITIVGDEDQSIFSFNGADVSGFDSFRKDFPNHREIRLTKNYRSTRCIVEAASSLINNNVNRCQMKQVLTDNSCGCKITVKECHNEVAQCAFVVDKILESMSDDSDAKRSFGNIAILYRRQVSGKVFQTAFRDRKIPFNVHGVAFYRKKVMKAIMAMLRTTVPRCDDSAFRQTFKTLLSFEKEEKRKVIDYIDKISTIRKCSFISAARDIFAAKISGTFKRNQLSHGRKVLSTLDIISKLVHREQSISAVITSVANMLPQKYLLEQRAVVDVDGGKLLNEDNDLRSVLQYLLDDVSNFLANHYSYAEADKNSVVEGEKGCTNVLTSFTDYISMRESENFRSRRQDNRDSVTLTTIHQSKGLEWDTVFIVKANETEIPLLHENNGIVKENAASLEEERRLLYVAMTRARKKLYILYVIVDSSWQLLQPSRFLKEIPIHLREVQTELTSVELQGMHEDLPKVNVKVFDVDPRPEELADVQADAPNLQCIGIVSSESVDLVEACGGDAFLKRFSVEDRAMISHLFHQWAKKKAFEEPKRLLDKIGFVIDERLRIKTNKNKDVLRALKSCLSCAEAFQYAQTLLLTAPSYVTRTRGRTSTSHKSHHYGDFLSFGPPKQPVHIHLARRALIIALVRTPQTTPGSCKPQLPL